MTRFALVLVAACGASQTTVTIDIKYDDTWSLTQLQLTDGAKSSTIGAAHQITIVVPDAWAGMPQSIALLGMQNDTQWAQGTATVTPKLGDNVDTSASLALLSCPTTCVEGASACVAGGLATCTQGADSCFAFGPPTACGSGMRCDSGACIAGDPVVLPSNSQSVGVLEQTGTTLDVETGYVFDTDSDCYDGSALGACAPVTPVGSPAVCVCRADTITIHDLEVRGSRALAILAWTSVTVKGNVVVDQGVGLGASYSTDGTSGGSYSTLGGSSAAPTYGNAELVPLVGGMSGQGATAGVGGGALQITADALVRVEGSISAPGGGALGQLGGLACGPDGVGHGGGSGSGSIGDGPGGDSSAPRSGSYTGCTTTDYTVYGLDGGGGGGAGRIRVNTFSDACGCTGFLSPTPTYGTVVVD
jgi:hypothetical protein